LTRQQLLSARPGFYERGWLERDQALDLKMWARDMLSAEALEGVGALPVPASMRAALARRPDGAALMLPLFHAWVSRLLHGPRGTGLRVSDSDYDPDEASALTAAFTAGVQLGWFGVAEGTQGPLYAARRLFLTPEEETAYRRTLGDR